MLGKLGSYLPEFRREGMMRELLEMKAAENAAPTPMLGAVTRYDPAMGSISSGVLAAYDPVTDLGGAANAATLGAWADEYLAGMEAAKMVLEFLKAQSSMDLFQTNPKAKRLYERIVGAGVDEVLYNNRRWQR